MAEEELCLFENQGLYLFGGDVGEGLVEDLVRGGNERCEVAMEEDGVEDACGRYEHWSIMYEYAPRLTFHDISYALSISGDLEVVLWWPPGLHCDVGCCRTDVIGLGKVSGGCEGSECIRSGHGSSVYQGESRDPRTDEVKGGWDVGHVTSAGRSAPTLSTPASIAAPWSGPPSSFINIDFQGSL